MVTTKWICFAYLSQSRVVQNWSRSSQEGFSAIISLYLNDVRSCRFLSTKIVMFGNVASRYTARSLVSLHNLGSGLVTIKMLEMGGSYGNTIVRVGSVSGTFPPISEKCGDFLVEVIP